MTIGPADPRHDPTPRHAPGDTPPTHEPQPRRAPGPPDGPDTIEAPQLPDPDAPEDVPVPGSVGVDGAEAHIGATEEDIGDRTGPGAGYDQGNKR
jgi:hypothetical protein